MPDNDSLFRILVLRPTELPNLAHALATRDPTHCALGAFADDRIVGLGNFTVLGTARTAELAVTVAPDQDDTFSPELLHRLARLARERGVERFVAELIPANTRLMRLVADAGFPVTVYRQNGIARVGIQL